MFWFAAELLANGMVWFAAELLISGMFWFAAELLINGICQSVRGAVSMLSSSALRLLTSRSSNADICSYGAGPQLFALGACKCNKTCR